MARETYDPKTKTWTRKEKPIDLRPIAPAVHPDEIMGGMKSMADCKVYTSKSAYRRSLREQGFIELGNDEDTRRPEHWTEHRDYQERLEGDAEQAWYAVRDGMSPMTEIDRERCKAIDHNLEHYNFDRREFDEYGNPRN